MASSLQKGIEAAKFGKMDEALTHLKDAIIEEPENANVWVWLSAIIEDENKQEFFLKRALEIDPENRPAQRGLAYLARKKTVPPKPGETLSDYTKPIGLFHKTTTQADVNVVDFHEENKPNFSAPQQTLEPATAQPLFEKPGASQFPPSSTPTEIRKTKNKVWLDVLLYSIILLVFVFIGILVGSTFLNVELPFLSAPTPVLLKLPSDEGVFLFLNNQDYLEMQTHFGSPEIEEGIPITENNLPDIVISKPIIDLKTMQIKFEDGTLIPFEIFEADKTTSVVKPIEKLKAGLHCIIQTLDTEKSEALYWCFRIK